MRLLITGAGGFVGRALVRQILAENAPTQLILLDRALPDLPNDPRILAIAGDLMDKSVRDRAMAGGIDAMIHMATIPGGAAEADRALSRRINIDASLDLFDAAAAGGNRPRIVFTSTIAVLPAPPPAHIDDATALEPFLSYGAHKLMCETYLADLHRRGEVEAVSVRLPGILARPKGPSGMKSAFISDMFHAALADEPFTCPTSPDGHIWAMSVEQVSRNLRHALSVKADLLPPSRAVTLPALRFSMGELAQALDAKVTFAPDPILEQQFAAQPPLTTAAADRAGFQHDNDLTTLVRRALAEIRTTTSA
ncbi:MAG: NAD-dependent epimerase/dehydratase family protein [Asticcacaulis sp.]|uniref:NAD-dependent epimerase/dehydratase family protein n=1 Tax=Asticcacaulis sp. TaxID=1872648 RepID=UPI0039E54812